MDIKRIEPKMITQIERWLEAWATGQYGCRLTWDKLAIYSGFSRQSLSANRTISQAYRSAKVAIKRGFQRQDREPLLQEHEARVTQLKRRIEQLEQESEAWASLWERWRYNARQQGWDVAKLDLEMPKPTQRKLPRH